jgi:hypothetical protein
MLVQCATCNVEFNKNLSEIKKTKNNFCSRACSATFNNAGKRRHPPRTCQTCSCSYVRTKTHRSFKYCVECVTHIHSTNDIKNMTKKEYQERESVKGKHPSWLNAHIRNFNRSWNSDLRSKPCQKCGYSTHVELAHIKAIHEFSEDSLLSEINNPSNILVLCPNHHWEFDNGILLLQDIPSL